MCQDKHKVFSKEWWSETLFTEIKNVRGPKVWDLDKGDVKFDDIQFKDIIEFSIPIYGEKTIGFEKAQQRVDGFDENDGQDRILLAHDVKNGEDFPEKKDRWFKKDIENWHNKIKGYGFNKLTEAVLPDEDRTKIVGEFIKFCFKKLSIKDRDFNIKLSKDLNKVKEIRSFGTFEPSSKDIWVYWGDGRNIADVCRTVGHELVHRKQDEEGKIGENSGNDGTDIENEANSQAGVLLREFGRIESRIYG